MHVRWISRVVAAGAVAAGLAALPGVVAKPAAQKGGGATGPGGTEAAVMATAGAREMTPFERFADKLKLDEKTQVPAAAEILQAAAGDAGPVAVEILQLRQKLLNVSMSGSAEDLKQVQVAYEAAAAKMARIEASSFAKVYAMLKPNQQSNAPQAFASMTGIFQTGPVRGGGAGGRGGR